MSIDFDPYGPLRRKLASDGVDIAAKLGSHRQALTQPVIRTRAAARRRIVFIGLLGSAILRLGPIASIAPLTTIAFGNELRDTIAAGAGRAGVAESTAPKLGPERRRGEAKSVVLGEAQTRDREKGAGDPPALTRMCAEALASEPLRNMDEYLDDIGVHYEVIFDQALSGADCTGRQVSDYLLGNGAYLDKFISYNKSNNYYLKYRSKNFLKLVFFLPFHVSIVEGKDGIFRYSRWNVTFI